MGPQQQKDEEEGGAVQRWKVAAGVTMDLDILDCPICCHPLRPPIFQVPYYKLVSIESLELTSF